MMSRFKLTGIKADILVLLACVSLSELAGIAGAAVTYPAIGGWYAGLEKPWFTPPNWLFGPAWTALYALMGISLFFVVTSGMPRKEKRLPLAAFGTQLALNAAWSFLFFGLRSPAAGLAGIVLLWAAIVVTIMLFWRVSRKAAVLLLPYIAWVTYAGMLNYFVWILNA